MSIPRDWKVTGTQYLFTELDLSDLSFYSSYKAWCLPFNEQLSTINQLLENEMEWLPFKYYFFSTHHIQFSQNTGASLL